MSRVGHLRRLATIGFAATLAIPIALLLAVSLVVLLPVAVLAIPGSVMLGAAWLFADRIGRPGRDHPPARIVPLRP